MVKRILDIVDMQNDFMQPDGALYVSGAEQIIPKANRFLAALQAKDFDLVLLKFDTHFSETYDQNPESKMFPPHCLFNSKGWDLAIDLPADLPAKIPTYRMNKNVFDMWAAQPDLNSHFRNDFNARAYKNLFTAQRWPQEDPAAKRDDFMDRFKIGKDTEVVMMGVAADFCVKDAILGYLKRGARVTVLEDMVQGIADDIKAVVQSEDLKKYTRTGQLRVTTSTQYKLDMDKEARHDNRSKTFDRTSKPHRRGS
ncbi:MAG: isochorismatase family protein [Pseudomonadota bacterium]